MECFESGSCITEVGSHDLPCLRFCFLFFNEIPVPLLLSEAICPFHIV